MINEKIYYWRGCSVWNKDSEQYEWEKYWQCKENCAKRLNSLLHIGNSAAVLVKLSILAALRKDYYKDGVN